MRELSKRHLQCRGLLACALAIALAGCASSSVNKVVDLVPTSVGGLPTDAPDRPEIQPAYPAVHDMPPPRANTTLTAEEQVKLENDLTAIRTRQQVITGVTPASTKRPQAPAAAQAPRIIPAASSTSIY